VHFSVRDFLLDLVQNSIEAGARTGTVRVVEDRGLIEASVGDDGKGMDEAVKAKAMDPFWTDGEKHARRRVGLGIPFLVHALRQAGGDWELESAPGSGTLWRFSFPADGVDTPPLGDMAGLALSAMAFDGDYELVMERRAPARGTEWTVRRSELRDAVGELTDAGSLTLARAFLESQEEPLDGIE